MSDNDLYHSNIAKLKDFYKLASDNSGKQQFYVFLYGYIKAIDDNEVFKNAANIFWFASYLNDHKDDKKLQELLKSMTAAGDEPSNKQKTENLLSLFKLVLTDDIKEARLYYSWILLYFVFYSVYRLNPEALKEDDFSGVDLKEFLGTSVSMDELKQMNSNLRRTFKSEDSDSTPFSRDMFATCLHIFHTEFINWLPENVDSLVEAQPTEQRTEVELSFDYNYPVVTNTVTHDVYRFGRMVETGAPYRIISHCRKKPNILVSAATLPPDIQLGQKGLFDTLRGSDFYPDKGALSVFITAKKRPAKIMLRPKVRLNNSELQALIKEADEVITNS